MMAGTGSEWRGSRLIEIAVISLLLMSSLLIVSAKGRASSYNDKEDVDSDHVMKVWNSLWEQGRLSFDRIWPVMRNQRGLPRGSNLVPSLHLHCQCSKLMNNRVKLPLYPKDLGFNSLELRFCGPCKGSQAILELTLQPKDLSFYTLELCLS